MGIDTIIRISHKYGGNEEYVLAGGGNTSYKTSDHLYIKGSGHALATIEEDGFVKMSRDRLEKIWHKEYPKNVKDREAQVLADMMASRCEGEELKRPSVETLLHNLFKNTYVLHVHPTRVNGITCSQNGEKAVKRLFPNAVWIEETEPGYILASVCRKKLGEYREKNGKDAVLLFLQNHGIFFAADGEDEMNMLVSSVMRRIKIEEITEPDFSDVLEIADSEKITERISSALKCHTEFTVNKEIERLCKNENAFSDVLYPMTPDHIVYCKSSPLFVNDIGNLEDSIESFKAKHGFSPKIIFVKNVGMFSCGNDAKDCSTAKKLWLDEIKISVYAKNFGGVRPMAPEMIEFIANWEVESYRSKVALKR